MEGEAVGQLDGEALAAELGVAPVVEQPETAPAEAADAEPQGNSKGRTADAAATTAAGIGKAGKWNELKRQRLAAEAQQGVTATDQAFPGEANAETAAEKMAGSNPQGKSRGAERKEERSEAADHAADAAKAAANSNAAIFAMAGAAMAKVQDDPATPAAADQDGEFVDAAAVDSATQKGALALGLQEDSHGQQLVMVTPEEMAAMRQSAAQSGQPMHSAFQRGTFYAAGPAAPGAAVKQQEAKAAASAETGNPLKEGGTATAGKLDQPLMPETAASQGEKVKGATEGAQQQAAVSNRNGESQATKSQTAEQVEAKAQQPENAAQTPAGKNEPRPVEGNHRFQIVEKAGAEQGAVAPKPASEAPSGGNAAPAHNAKFTPLQGISGQNGSGNAGHDGHPGQNAQGSDQMQAAMMGMQTTRAADAPQPEAKVAGSKSALHESILAQVKDGVVTRHADGNSQISIRLNPEELGELKIHVRMEDNRLKVEVQADNRAVKDLLMSNLDSLKDALSAKNFTMEGFDVSSGGGFNSALNEQKGNPQQQAMPRFGKGGGYSQPVERQVKYVTADSDSLLSVRF